MRTSDLIRSALGGLWRQKARTALTLLGVAVGGCALAFSLSLGDGLKAFIENEFKTRDEFWWVNVHPKNWGRGEVTEADIPADELAVPADVPEERRARVRRRLVEQYRMTHPPKRVELVTDEKVAALRRLPDVEDVRVYRTYYANVWLGERHASGQLFAGDPAYLDPPVTSHLLAGRTADPAAADEVVVSEFLLHKLGARTDAEISAAVGRRMRVVLGAGEFKKAGSMASLLAPGGLSEELTRSQSQLMEKIAAQMPDQIDKFDLTDLEKTMVKAVTARKPKPAAPKDRWDQSAAAEFTVVGVTREPDPPKETDIFTRQKVPLGQSDVRVAAGGGQRLFGQFPEFADYGYPEANVKVRPGGDLAGAVQQIEGTGLECYSGLKFYQNVRREIALITAGLTLFAMISLLVASIGITNTLFTSVLERTREIGVWKSLGARDGHVLLMFLIEGTVIGVLGGALGLALAGALSIPADGFVRHLIEQQSTEKLGTDTVFHFPPWLTLGTVGFSALLTTLAALYPAMRAARVQPVEALRHE